MTQRDLNRAVARATGETVHTVAQFGFGPADPGIVDFDPEPSDVEAKIVDWDALDEQRVALMPA